jgi:hypothetical protein
MGKKYLFCIMANNLRDIIKSAENLGYTIDKRPNKLNIIGVRNSKATSQDKFDDLLAYFTYDANGNLIGKVVPATTDPSTYFLKSPINVKGAAILKSGQYKDAYQIGLHRGKYEALVQAKPVTVIRDSDRNSLINYFAPTQTGLYGINIHKSTKGKQNEDIIDFDSAGCQVFRNIPEFMDMMRLAQTSRKKYGNSFTYTLIDERDTLKFRNTTLSLIIGVSLLALSGYLFTKKR